MSDITIPPTTSSTTIPTSGQTGVVQNPPPSILSLTSGTIVEAEVIGPNSQNGLTQIKTPQGMIEIQTKAQLLPGSQIQMEIITSGTVTRVAILSVKQPPREATPSGPTGTKTTEGNAATTNTAAPKAAPPLPVLNQGQIVKALFLPLPQNQPVAPPSGGATTPAAPTSQTAATPAPQVTQQTAQPSAPTATGSTPITNVPSAPLVNAAPASQPSPAGSTATPAPGNNSPPPPVAGQTSTQATPAPTSPNVTTSSLPLPTAAGTTPPTPTQPSTPAAAQGATTTPPQTSLQTASQTPAQTIAQAAQPPTQTTPPLPSSNPLLSAQENLTRLSQHQMATESSAQQSSLAKGEKPNLSELTIRIQNLTPSPSSGTQTTTTPPPTSSQANLQNATVMTQSPQGEVILQTPQGLIQVKAQTPLPPGSFVQFEVLQQTPLNQAAGAQPAFPLTQATQLPTASLLAGWPRLEAILKTAMPQQIDLLQALQKFLPQPNQNLAASLAVFMHAAQKGQIEEWVGKRLGESLRHISDEDVGELLNQDFRNLHRTMREGNTEWKAFYIPLYDESNAEALRMFVKSYGEENAQSGKEESHEGTRFILDLAQTAMGRLQIDGLIRPQKLDLVLRSQIQIPEIMQSDIQQIYQNALEVTGFSGTLHFSIHKKSFPLEPLAMFSSHEKVTT